jgi:hypothetical protein
MKIVTIGKMTKEFKYLNNSTGSSKINLTGRELEGEHCGMEGNPYEDGFYITKTDYRRKDGSEYHVIKISVNRIDVLVYAIEKDYTPD